MKKIIIFIADISKAGGTERATINLANILCKHYKVKIITLSHSTQPFFLLDNRVEVSALNVGEFPIPMTKKILWYFNFLRRLKKVIRMEQPYFVIGEGHNISTLLPLAKNAKTKTIACEHIDFETIPTLSKKLMKMFYTKLDRVVVLSEIAKQKLQTLTNKIDIIPNSLPFEVEIKSSHTDKRIIMVGRISAEKGYERVVPIAKKMLVDFPDWKIHIFGDGDLKEQMKKLYEENHLTNVEIKSPTKEIKQEYLKSSIHLITSYNEAMPMVILEAQHCGLPVLGYYCEGTNSLIENGKTGFIAETENDLYEKLKSLISDEQLRVKIGNQARKESEQYSIKNIEKQWIALLRGV